MARRSPADREGESASVLHCLQLDDPSDSWMDQLREAESASPYGRLGSYELLEEVGRGGQGIVYRSREVDTGRRVAVKRLLAGPFSSAGNRRRLERELEALRRLEHPGIVSGLSLEVVDSCTFLSMEWIDGVSVTDWCQVAERTRPVAEILQMLIKVCDAVHHAHQRGVIHRDLKPSNILIDSEGEPHVIDFGLAKILDCSPNTLTGRFLGTAPYASLEQLYGDARDVDVRSDVYSLGIILYEAITGTLPYGRARSAASIARAIEQEAPRSPSAVGRRVAPDLEAVIMKAIAKDRELRYQSLNSFADDLRRFLDQEPVEARVDTKWSRILRTLRRHPVLTTAAATAFAAVSTLATTTGVLAARAAGERDTALTATLQAQEETARSEAINGFLHRMLVSALPRAGGHEVTLREILDDASEEIETGIGGQPLVEADIRNTVGTLYHQLGLYDKAQRQLEAAVGVLREHVPSSDPNLATGLNNLGLLTLDRGDYEQAESLLREAHSIRIQALGDSDLSVAESLNNLAGLVFRRGDYDGAAEMYREALSIQRNLIDGPTARIATNLGNLARAVQEQGDLQAARLLFEEALSMHREVHGEAHPDVANAMSILGGCLSDQGEHERAEELQRSALKIYEEILGPRHPLVAGCLDALGRTALARERHAEAVSWLRRALTVRTTSLGENHPSTAISYNNLGRALLFLGEHPEAHDLFQQAIAVASLTLPQDHWNLAGIRSNLGECLVGLGRYEAAERELLASHSVLLATFGSHHARTQKAAAKLIGLYGAWNKPEQAAAWRSKLEEREE